MFTPTFAAISATSAVDPDEIVYHISVTAKQRRLYLQLIIVDRYEYNEHSTKLMESMRKYLAEMYGSEQIQKLSSASIKSHPFHSLTLQAIRKLSPFLACHYSPMFRVVTSSHLFSAHSFW